MSAQGVEFYSRFSSSMMFVALFWLVFKPARYSTACSDSTLTLFMGCDIINTEWYYEACFSHKNISFCELKACRRLLSLPGKFSLIFACANWLLLLFSLSDYSQFSISLSSSTSSFTERRFLSSPRLYRCCFLYICSALLPTAAKNRRQSMEAEKNLKLTAKSVWNDKGK